MTADTRSELVELRARLAAAEAREQALLDAAREARHILALSILVNKDERQ